MKRFRFSASMIGVYFILTLSTGSKAQTFTPVPYNFQASPGAFPGIDGMAANGYGLWLHVGSGSPIWELAGNGNTVYASGSDDHGFNARDTKVAANLRGSVRYVTLDSAQTGFIVAGIDDTECHSSSHQLSLNIPYSALDNIFSDTSKRHVETGSEYVYSTASTKVTGEPGCCYSPELETVNESLGSAQPEDWDIAMDGHFLYIVWHHYETTDYWSGNEIFLTCVNLSNGSVAPGFPMILHTRIPGVDSLGVAVGILPTIACDVRNNSSGTFSPACDIAYIDDYGAVNHLWVASGTFHNETLPSNALVPADTTTYPNLHYGMTGIGTVKCARVMVASSGSGMENHVVGYYVIAGITEGTSLYFFDEVDGVFPSLTGTLYGWYVDGPNNQAQSFPPEAAPIGGYGQLVEPPSRITAFANPYDGENNGDYDEFHCVYGISSHSESGLMIVRGADNGVPWPTSPIPYQKDTRTVVNQDSGMLMYEPLNYYGAANQAGIHVVWNDFLGYNYSRDRRSYDEPIEEPTIMSFDNYVADGRGHNGTLGAQTNIGKFVLVEDNGSINFGNAGTDSNANDAGLTIGTTGATDPQVKLIIFPGFNATFQSPPLTSNRNFIQIDTRGSCDFYGGNFAGGGDFDLDVTTLNIMPGSNFAMTNQDTTGFPRLISSHGTIISLNGAGADHNPQDNGIISIDGALVVDSSVLTCSAVDTTLLDLVTLNGEAKCPFASNITNSTVKDTATVGQALVYFNDPLNAITIDSSSFTAIGLKGFFADHEYDIPLPNRPFSVTNCSFDSIMKQGIHLISGNGGTRADYDILLGSNDFLRYIAHGSDGILLEDFQSFIPGDLATYGTPINISLNNFTYSNTTFDTSHVEAAIHLINTSAVIDDNWIGGERTNGTSTYAYGIKLDPIPSNPANSSIANTLICTNRISHVGYAPGTVGETGGGIYTSYWNGYEKMNEVYNSAQGSIFGVSDAGKYLLANYHDNNGPGINNTDGTTVKFIEMRGLIHNIYGGDMAGYNDVYNNNLDFNSSLGEIVVANGVTLHIGNEKGTGYGSVAYGENWVIENTTTDKLIFGPIAAGDSCMIGANSRTPDSCLNNNIYQVADSGYVPAGISLDPQFGGKVLYNSTAGVVSTLNLIFKPTLACYTTSEIMKHGHDRILSVDTASTDECERLDNVIDQLFDGGEYQQDYDTIKTYVTLCYNQPLAWKDFGEASDDVDGIAHAFNNGNLAAYDDLREWLKSVLYLRTDTSWYCADVYAIVHSFKDYPGHGSYLNAMEAVTRYILKNNRCDSEWSSLFATGIIWPLAIETLWSDTVRDSLTEARPDTSVPSIDSIGLSILRGAPSRVAPIPISPGTDNIIGLYATENPFTQSTAIKFTLADYGLVTFQLFDVLGHAVTTNGIGQVLYPGAHEFDIDGSKLPPGNYIARVAFHDGDVESIMVEKK